jgi:hypothetical protein
LEIFWERAAKRGVSLSQDIAEDAARSLAIRPLAAIVDQPG